MGWLARRLYIWGARLWLRYKFPPQQFVPFEVLDGRKQGCSMTNPVKGWPDVSR